MEKTFWDCSNFKGVACCQSWAEEGVSLALDNCHFGYLKGILDYHLLHTNGYDLGFLIFCLWKTNYFYFWHKIGEYWYGTAVIRSCEARQRPCPSPTNSENLISWCSPRPFSKRYIRSNKYLRKAVLVSTEQLFGKNVLQTGKRKARRLPIDIAHTEHMKLWT